MSMIVVRTRRMTYSMGTYEKHIDDCVTAAYQLLSPGACGEPCPNCCNGGCPGGDRLLQQCSGGGGGGNPSPSPGPTPSPSPG
eukprot:51065-Eustigmatos_ZCMA.PRE.1